MQCMCRGGFGGAELEAHGGLDADIFLCWNNLEKETGRGGQRQRERGRSITHPVEHVFMNN